MTQHAAINPKTPIKLEPQNIKHPRQKNVDGDKTAPICKREEEDWNGDHQRQLQQQPQPQVQMTQMQCPQALNYQKLHSFQRSNSKTFDVSDQYPSQLKLYKQWEEEMERLNSKYNLDCFSDSELDFELDEGEEYKYDHGYETLI